MSKNKSNDLFQLVKSLRKSEKRYFKVLTSRENGKTNKKYIQLFDLIDGNDDFNENKILASEKWIKPQQFSNLKAHLYKKILQSLRLYHSGQVLDLQIREMVDHVEILFNKGLYNQCVNVLKKAKKIAVRSDNLELQLEILKWEKTILYHTVGRDNQKRVNKIISEVQKVNNRINHINIFSNLSVKLNSIYLRIGFIRNESDFQLVSDMLNSGLPGFEEDKLSFNEKLSLYNLYVGYYSFIQDFENGYLYAKKWVELFGDSKKLIISRLEMYIRGLNNLMISQNKLLKYDEFMETKEKLRALRRLSTVQKNENLSIKIFKYTYVHEFNGLFMRGDFRGGVQLMEKIKPGLHEFIDRLDNHSRIILYYKIACLYFGGEDYKEALHWLNRIINYAQVDIREDVHCFARILNLICHYELGNADIIDYSIRSTYRFLLKKDDLHQYQKYILSFLKRLGNEITEKQLLNQFKNLRRQLLPLVNSQFEKRAFIYFDIISWLESKIEKKPVSDIIRNKAASNRQTLETVAQVGLKQL